MGRQAAPSTGLDRFHRGRFIFQGGRARSTLRSVCLPNRCQGNHDRGLHRSQGRLPTFAPYAARRSVAPMRLRSLTDIGPAQVPAQNIAPRRGIRPGHYLSQPTEAQQCRATQLSSCGRPAQAIKNRAEQSGEWGMAGVLLGTLSITPEAWTPTKDQAHALGAVRFIIDSKLDWTDRSAGGP